MRISAHDNWQHIHWNAIASAYGSSPFFEYYRDDFAPFYEKSQSGRFLLDYNNDLQKMVCRLLGIAPIFHIVRTISLRRTVLPI